MGSEIPVHLIFELAKHCFANLVSNFHFFVFSSNSNIYLSKSDMNNLS